MPAYKAIAHISWELPFPLRLPPNAFFCWEPSEGVGLFDPRPDVGELVWRRKSSFLAANDVFADIGPPNDCYPNHDYLITSKLRSGREIKTAILTRGPTGGFAEARPYAIANIFLCLRDKAAYATKEVLERAGIALNHILDVYRFVTIDPLVRSVRADLDCYYAVVSVAELPSESGDIEAEVALRMIGGLSFGSVIGVNRTHHVGLNSFDDLFAGEPITDDILGLFTSLIEAPHNLELFHQLIFSAVRRLKRNEHALAVLDAQSAVESLVAVLVNESLQKQGQTAQQIEAEMAPGGRLHTLQRRFEEVDRLAVLANVGGPHRRFLGSTQETNWRQQLYRLRNRIVHEGLRSVPFAEAKTALVAGLNAIHSIQDLTPSFTRSMMWSGASLDLRHIQPSAGRLSRLFEA